MRQPFPHPIPLLSITYRESANPRKSAMKEKDFELAELPDSDRHSVQTGSNRRVRSLATTASVVGFFNKFTTRRSVKAAVRRSSSPPDHLLSQPPTTTTVTPTVTTTPNTTTMPVQSSITPDQKAKVKASIPNSSNKIYTAVFGRVYYAYPDPNDWSFSGLTGAIAFVKDNSRDGVYFRMVDLQGTRGVIWEHELYDDMEYNQDRPFFHTFAGDVSYIFGFVFIENCLELTFGRLSLGMHGCICVCRRV